MFRVFRIAASAAAGFSLCFIALEASDQAAADDAAAFMQSFSGDWHGQGRLLIGPDMGKHFHCQLKGQPSRSKLTFKMQGKCWMGRLSAKVHASLRYNAEQQKFFGTFMDGAKGDGVDVVGERLQDGSGFVMRLSREQAQGILVAETDGSGLMEVNLSLLDRANQRDIPVAAMGFGRPEQVGSLSSPGKDIGSLAAAATLSGQ